MVRAFLATATVETGDGAVSIVCDTGKRSADVLKCGARLASRLDSSRAAVVAVAAVYFLFIVARLALHGGDPSVFVLAGDRVIDPQLVPRSLTVLKDSTGYDGQFYYVLALGPFADLHSGVGRSIDSPSYRQQRIVYPLAVWLASLGQADLAPAMMILINYAALCVLAWVGASYARFLGQHSLWGIAIPLYPGLLLALARDLAEILEVAFLLAGLLLLWRGRQLLAALLLTLAVLSRETAIVAVLGLACATAFGPRKLAYNKGFKSYVILIPFLSLAGWQIFLTSRWGQLPFQGGSMNLGVPFNGLVGFILDTLHLGTPRTYLWFVELCFLLLFTAGVAHASRVTRASVAERLIWLLYGLLACALTRLVWVEDWAFLRVLSEFYVIGAVILIGSGSKYRYVVFGVASALWVTLAVLAAVRL